MLLVLVAVGYFAVNFGEVYYRYFMFKDAMEQEVRFAARRSDDDIRRRLRATADSLGLPEGAQTINVLRTGQAITIWADYYEHIELPLLVRELHFAPHAEAAP